MAFQGREELSRLSQLARDADRGQLRERGVREECGWVLQGHLLRREGLFFEVLRSAFCSR